MRSSLPAHLASLWSNRSNVCNERHPIQCSLLHTSSQSAFSFVFFTTQISFENHQVARDRGNNRVRRFTSKITLAGAGTSW
jgi:hypothetical protein